MLVIIIQSNNFLSITNQIINNIKIKEKIK